MVARPLSIAAQDRVGRVRVTIDKIVPQQAVTFWEVVSLDLNLPSIHVISLARSNTASFVRSLSAMHSSFLTYPLLLFGTLCE